MRRIPAVLIGLAWLVVGCGSQAKVAETVDTEVLMDPQSAAMQEQAPAEFQVLFQTSAGDFTLDVTRELAPAGADRFYNLVRNGFYDEQRFFRVLPGFVVQWGMHGDPKVMSVWQTANIMDDPVKASNTPGTITFAKTGSPNSRSTQLFINLGDNSSNLDRQGFAPFGRVTQGMEVVEAINAQYRDNPKQQQITARGNEYLTSQFPELDYIKSARIAD
jgi:peptidyl-prolyl cis-trans isomerase A (cyclophilin A)